MFGSWPLYDRMSYILGVARPIFVGLDDEAFRALTQLEADEDDRSEMQAVAELMESLRAPGCDIFELRMPRGVGHEQQGTRFGVVVQSEAFLPRSVVLIAPTSTRARAASFRPEIEMNGTVIRVRVEQVGAVDIGRLGDLVGHITPQERWVSTRRSPSFCVSTDPASDHGDSARCSSMGRAVRNDRWRLELSVRRRVASSRCPGVIEPRLRAGPPRSPRRR